MNSFTLNFFDKARELSYQKDTKIASYMNFYSFLLIELILGIAIVLSNIIQECTLSRLISIPIIIVLFCIIIYLQKKYSEKKFIFLIFLIIHLGILIVTVEVINHLYKDQKNYASICLIYSMPIIICLNNMNLVKIKWIWLSLINMIFHMYYIYRTYNKDQVNESPIILICNTVCIISFSTFVYTQEKTLRKLYEILADNNHALNNYKALLKNIIPSPILILNTEAELIEFHNNSATDFIKDYNRKNYLDLEKPNIYTQFCNILSQFNIVSNGKPGDFLIKEFAGSESSINPYINSNSLIIEFDSKCEETYYYNLDNAEKLLFHQRQLYFEEKRSENNLRNENKYFNFKFLKLMWEKKPCLLLIIDDITDIHRLEELQHLDKYKDQLLATVSHDLRTPLNGMLGMMESVAMNINTKKEKKNLNIAKKSGYLLLSMINDILDFSQINNQKLRLSFKKINLIEILKDTSKLIKFQAKSKGLKFICNIEEKLLSENAYINSDSNRIKQILLNLLNNALKFTSKGYIKLFLERNLNHTYKITVEDTGIGISELEKPKLFKLFGKLDDNSDLNRTGVGLGLTISQNLVQLLNENDQEIIHIESEVGKGSKFWFYLKGNESISPCNERDEVRKPYLFEKTSNKIPKKKKITVLLVDDDMVNIMVFKKYCEFFEIDYLTAYDGKEAVNIVEQTVIINNSEIDGIFMDCNMPILDGYNASIMINKMIMKENKNCIPIIAMTANIMHQENQKISEAGIKGFITKPVSRKLFGETVKSYLNVDYYSL